MYGLKEGRVKMSVKAIRLQNFMAFEDTGWIEFRPITLLFGRNSSGKSVIIRALRLLKQSLNVLPDDGPLAFATEYGLDQGLFQETIHGHKWEEKSLIFSFRCVLEKSQDVLLQVINDQRERNGQPSISEEEATSQGWQWADLSLGFCWDGQKILPTWLSIECPWAERLEQTTVFVASRDIERHIDEKTNEPQFIVDKQWKFKSDFLYDHILASEETFESWPYVQLPSGFLPRLEASKELLFSNPASEENFDFVRALLSELCQTIKALLADMEHLGPIRPEPERVYKLTPIVHQRWRERGLQAWFRFIQASANKSQEAEIEKWLQELDLGTKFNKDRNRYGNGLYAVSEVRVQELADDMFINLTDMGFGASQVLPVIALSVLAKEGSLVIIEQPELHLHPSAQAQMADLFIDSISQATVKQDMADQNEVKHAARFLLETHSEYLLLRLLRRIAETSAGMQHESQNPHQFLQRDDLGIYFVHRNNKGVSSTEEIKVAANGDLMNTPKGFEKFFADSLRETIARARAARNIK